MNKKKKIQIIFGAIIIILTMILSFSVYKVVDWYLESREIKKFDKELKEKIEVKEINDEGILINQPEDLNSDYWEYIKKPFYDADLSKLIIQNEDIIGYIKINNTNISYPIVKSKDNNDYIYKNIYKENSDAGSIFMDYRNDFTSDNIIIYGHARNDGTMFGTLKNALKTEWQMNKDNHLIYISTPKENYLYQIFSIYTVQSEEYYLTPNFNSTQEKEKWLNTMLSRNESIIKTNVDLNDKILTLSTCQNTRGKRLVVHAKLIKKLIKND